MAAASFLQHQRRFNLALPLRVWFRGQTKQGIVVEDTVTVNVSSGGCYFYLGQKPVIGKPVKMEIVLPVPKEKETRIRCRGTIIRVEEGQGDQRFGIAATIEHYQIIVLAENQYAA